MIGTARQISSLSSNFFLKKLFETDNSIIDFYVRYIFSTELNDSVKNKCHVFSSFFYQRLTTRPPKVVGRYAIDLLNHIGNL